MRRAIRKFVDFIQLLLFLSLFLGMGTYYLLVVENHKFFMYGFLLALAALLLVMILLLRKVFVDNSPARLYVISIIINAFIAVLISFVIFSLPLLGFDYASIPNKLVAVVAIFFGARAFSKLKPAFFV